jgi:hypothetical protein
MPTITSATITAFYLFDVAEAIDLAALRAAIGGGAINARLTTKSAAPSYLQYATPPVVVDGDALDVTDVDGFKLRVKFFDYGVLSLALTRPFAGDWPELIGLSQIYIENAELERRVEKIARRITERFAAVLKAGRASFLSEDYLVVAVTSFAAPTTADDLVATRAQEIATVVRGERQTLSRQELAEVMSHRLSYLADDLVVPTWNAAFVCDTDAGVQAALEIFEFANSQLLEFRYYDQLLDEQLTRIYVQLEKPPRFQLFDRGYVAATRHLHALFVDVNEITDRTENALKMVGDIYSARLFRLAAARLGLASWKESVKEKLKTLDDIYRFAVEHTGMARGEFLELTVVLLIVLEIVLLAMGVG